MSKTKKKATPIVPRMHNAKGYIDRVKALLVEQRAYGVDITEVCTEAKEKDGLEPAMIRFAAREALIEESVRKERDEKRGLYLHALGLAVEAVRSGDLSLREAGRVYKLPKSNIHRALAVPAVSHDPDTGEVHDEEGRPEAPGADSAGDRAASGQPTQAEPRVLPGRSEGADERGQGSAGARLVQSAIRQDGGGAVGNLAQALRAQIPTSTDPGRLEREAAALEGDFAGSAPSPESRVDEIAPSPAKAEAPCASSTMPSDIGKDDADTGTHSGGDACTESCGGQVEALSTSPTQDPVVSGTLDASVAGRGSGTSHPLDNRPAGVAPGPHDPHASDCAVHNEPAMPNGPCDCGAAGDTRGETRPNPVGPTEASCGGDIIQGLEAAEQTWLNTLRERANRNEGVRA